MRRNWNVRKNKGHNNTMKNKETYPQIVKRLQNEWFDKLSNKYGKIKAKEQTTGASKWKRGGLIIGFIIGTILTIKLLSVIVK